MTQPKETFADAFKTAVEAGDIVVEFGRVGQAPSPGAGRTVAVSDRVVLPIDTARRLLVSLGECLRQHATELRAAEAKALSPGEAAVAARPGQAAAQAAPDEAGRKAQLLLRLVGELDVPHQYERSFRIAEGSLLANRFLLTLNRADIQGDPRARVLGICDQLDMPGELREAAGARFEMAHCVHFGFEADPEGIVAKLYLERRVPPEEAQRARARGEPLLLHLAFKWALGGGARVTTEYLWHPALSAGEIAERLARHVYRDGAPGSLDIAREVLALAAGRVAAEKLQYLEVQEPGNGRRSFDLNLYNARLEVKDAQTLLYRMRDLYGVRPGRFQALYDQIAAKSLGHLAGGVHRDGRDFFNLYYGVAGFPRFHDRFQ